MKRIESIDRMGLPLRWGAFFLAMGWMDDVREGVSGSNHLEA